MPGSKLVFHPSLKLVSIMSFRDFKFHLVSLPVLFLVASLLGVITPSWWAAALFGLGFSLVYSFLSGRVSRKVSEAAMAKARREPAMAFHFTRLVCDTAALALSFWLFSFLGLASVPGLGFTVMAVITWLLLTRESLVTFVQLCMLWLATRR
jgi:hypothetical protein